VIREVNIETQQRRYRSEEAFRLPQIQVIDGTNSQRSLVGQVRVDALTARLGASGRVPRSNRFFREPKRQLATLSKGGFVFISQPPGGVGGPAEAIRLANVDDAEVKNVTVDGGFFGVLSIGGQLGDPGQISTK
jgi:hypothetical protein